MQELVPRLYANNLKKREFDKKVPQIFCSERATIAKRQGASENEKSELQPTQSKTVSSSCLCIGRIFLLEAALGLLVLHSPISCAEDPRLELVETDSPIGILSAPPSKGGRALESLPEQPIESNKPSLPKSPSKDSYTINFNNISIIEYIRFVSKISNLNFVFDEGDLQFNVTIVSEDPVTPRNIMSILVQILRIHDLIVLEQEGNLIVTKAGANANQIATIVSSDLPEEKMRQVPLVTRVFRIKNANLNTIVSVIKPMMSTSALIETSVETRQLIVTDITTNVDKISSLLASIDLPHTSLEIDSYTAQNVAPTELVALATMIVSPFAEGNPLIFVPQPATDSIFIISTPYLIERSLAVLEDLDVPSKPDAEGSMHGPTSNIYFYKIQNRPSEDLMNAIEQVSSEIKKGGGSSKLVSALDSAKYIKDSNSILFMGDNETLKKIADLLPTFDITSAVSSQFFIYNPQYRSGDEIQKSLNEISSNLKESGLADPYFMQAIDSMKWVPSTNSLIFTGNTPALERINGMIRTIDTPCEVHAKGEVFLYKPHYASQDQLKHALDQLAKNLDSSNPCDARLQDSIASMKWIDDSQSFLFRADDPTLVRLKELLANLDTPEGLTGGNANTFFLYKLQSSQGEDVISNLKKVAQNLKDSGVPNPSLIDSLQNVRWIKDNNSLLLTGSTATIDQVKKLIDQFDSPGGHLNPAAAKSAFYIYKPLHRSPEEIQSSLQDVAKDLEASGLIDPDLLLTLGTMRNVESTHSLLFTGTPTSLEKVKELLVRVDTINPEAQIQQLGQLTFLIYKIQYVPPAQLIASLKGLSTDLANSGAINKEVVEAINTMKWIKETNSILFVGSAQTLQQVDSMIKKFDLASLAKEGSSVSSVPGTFVVYTPKNQPGDELIAIVDEFEQNLISSGLADKSLYDTINNLKWIPRTCSILISGTPDSITKVEDLLRRFDTPSKSETATPPSIESIENTSFLIYKLNYHQGDEIVAALKQVITEISGSNSANNQNLLSALNSLQWIQVTNSLLATGEGPTLAKVKDLISNLDIPLRQVFIEILIVETSLTNTQNFGLQWGGKLQWMNRFAAGSGNFPISGANTGNVSTNSAAPATGLLSTTPNLQNVTAAVTPTTPMIPFLTGFDLGVIGDIIMHKGRSFLSLGSLVNALQTDTDSHIVMNPKIITQDNRNSTIFVGNNLPYIGSVINTAGGINTSNNVSLEYRDIGINISITPMLGSNDITTLDIDTDISEVIGSPSQGTSGSTSTSTTTTVTGIQTSHTTMSTRVHVPDKHFVCLSGMLQDTKTHFKSQIPCLGGLPVIGAAFTETDRLNSKQNVLIFVRPLIINTYEEYKNLTDHQEDLYKETVVLPILKEEFDAGIDWVKTPENE